jgi:hypothetical protein
MKSVTLLTPRALGPLGAQRRRVTLFPVHKPSKKEAGRDYPRRERFYTALGQVVPAGFTIGSMRAK